MGLKAEFVTVVCRLEQGHAKNGKRGLEMEGGRQGFSEEGVLETLAPEEAEVGR